MAFLRPNVLIPISFNYFSTALDALTDVELGYVMTDFDLFYIDVRISDANDTFSAATYTLEYDDGASGADTTIDAISITANDVLTQVDRDGLSDDFIPAGSRILLTVSNISTGADQGVHITLWGLPRNITL